MPENMTTREIIIIGGGVSGATAAALLAQAGKDVLLLEKESGPHHKVCGEFISWEAVHYLRKLGINMHVQKAHAIRRLTVSFGSRHVSTPLPFDGYSLSRHKLDWEILHKARHAGAEIRMSQAVSDITRQDGLWHVKTQSGVIPARTIFLASGKLDIRGQARVKLPAPHSDYIGFKMHFMLHPTRQHTLANTVEMFFSRRFYAGIEMVEDGITNLCALVSKDMFHACEKNWHNTLEQMRLECPLLHIRLDGASAMWQAPLAIYGMPYGFIHRDDGKEPYLYRIGDQMAVIPSFAGDGIAIALHTAFAASKHYLLNNNSPAYYRDILKDLKAPVKTAKMVSHVLRRPEYHFILYTLLRAFPRVLHRVMRLTRLERVV